MKTTNNAQKTENGQVKTMVLRGAAVIISLVLISWTVSAQDFWKELLTNNTYGKMAMLMIDQPNDQAKSDVAIAAIYAELNARNTPSREAFVLETEADHELAIEAWMTDESNFSASTDFFAVDKEEAIAVEDWMINNVNFTTQSNSLTADAESALEIESWMLQENYFNSDQALTEKESALEIESWMLESKYFEGETDTESLELEAWMTDSSFWGF